jgi:hypothetical protein
MSRVTLLVIPSEVEESLTFCLSSIRDVSTSLDMTMNGQHESDLPFSGNRRHRVPLLLRRPRGRVRLHRRDDAVRARNHYHPADRIGTEHPGCADRVFSILAVISHGNYFGRSPSFPFRLPTSAAISSYQLEF